MALSSVLFALVATLLPDPDPAADRVIDNPHDLFTNLSSIAAEGGSLSLRLTGRVNLSEVPMATGTTILPLIVTGMSVTLWSDDATLDAEGRGRIFAVRAPSHAHRPSPRTCSAPSPPSSPLATCAHW